MLFLFVMVACAADDPFAVDAIVETLPNGLRVVIEEHKRTDTVAVHLHVGVGSRDEMDAERGVAHLFEHLMFEGSQNVPGNAYDEWLTAAGGSNNAFTSEDETAYHATFPSGALDLSLFLESDRLAFLHAGLTDDNLSNQQEVVLREREQGYAAPNGRDMDVISRLAFPVGHPYHVPVIGTVDAIRAFELDGVRSFHARWYRPRNAVLALVGNLDQHRAVERVKHWFSDVPDPGPVPSRSAVSLPHHTESQVGVLEDNVEDWSVYTVWPGVPAGHDDEAALFVATLILDNGRGTPMDDLVFRKGVVTDASVEHWAGEIDGLFIVNGSVKRPRPQWMQARTERMVRGLAAKGPSEAQLQRAKSRTRTLLLSQLERPENRAEVLADCVRLHNDVDCTRGEWARVQAVTSSDVQGALDRVLNGVPSTLYIHPRFEKAGHPDTAVTMELP